MSIHTLSHPLAGCGLRRLAAIAVLALAAPTAALADSNWASVGSTGALDDDCNGRARLSATTLLLAGGNSASNCTIRYQVVDTFGATGVIRRALSVGFVDNGAYAQVRARVHRMIPDPLGATPVARLDSNSYPHSTSNQRRTGATCVEFDFAKYVYVVEVELRKTMAPTGTLRGTPEITYVGLTACP